MAIVKKGSGTLWLNNNGSDYSGGTQVYAGTLKVGNNPGSGGGAATGVGPVTVAGGAMLVSETGGGNVGAPVRVPSPCRAALSWRPAVWAPPAHYP